MKRVGIDISRKYYNEHLFAESFAEDVSRILRRKGVHPIIYDCSSPEIKTQNHVKYIEQINQMNKDRLDCSISLHLEFGEKHARGSFCYCCSDRGMQLSKNIVDGLCPILPGQEYKIIKSSYITILNRTNHPCCVAILGFITSKADRSILKKKREAIASAIADGIIKFLNEQ